MKDLLIYLLAKNRKRFPVRQLNLLAEKIIHGCENYSYNFRFNGEEMVLHRFRQSGFSVFFDVGANRGDWSLLVRRHFPDSSVHCFEIAPPMHAVLKKAVSHLHPPVVVNEFGLSNKVGTVKLNFCHGADGSSTMLPTSELPEHDQIDAYVVTGDSYVEKQSIRKVDFLKLDVEGVENLVLEGFAKTLARRSVEVIQFEYGRENATAGFLLKDFYKLLEPLGYRIGKIFPDRVEIKDYSTLDENFIGPNFLAVRKERQDLVSMLS
jgi:FkbM family methyltransferase